jgi:hypothetical protein
MVDSMLLFEPVRSTVTGTDINNDGKLDLLIGNYAGGATWYSDQAVSISENKPNDISFSIYPNPAHGELNLRFFSDGKNVNHEIEITDVLGKIVYETANNSFSQTLNIKNWQTGMYFCRMIEQGNVITKKFIVMR